MAVHADTGARAKARNPLSRGLYFLLGMLCLALLPLSYLPGIPTFDLVLLAAFFFSMSSERMHDWLLAHPYFGPMIRNYRAEGLTMRMKWIAAAAIVVSIGVSGILFVDILWVRGAMAAVMAYALWFVFTRPTRRLAA
ncbi:MAG TPA: YbaN family protein [Acidimicrobiia bacterium]